MPKGFAHCSRCGRLYTSTPGKVLCARCTTRKLAVAGSVDRAFQQGYGSLEEITRVSGLPENLVREGILAMPIIQSTVKLTKPCALCKKTPAEIGGAYCGFCREKFSRILERAAVASRREAARQKRYVPERTMQSAVPTGHRAMLAEKRDRRFFRKYRPAPPSRWSA